MGRVQSNVGLITGVPIQETVENLLKISAQPRDLLISRTSALKQQQVALNSVTALVIAIQLAARNLGKANLFTDRKVSSSNPEILSADKSGTPLAGSYQFTAVRQAQTHQLLSGSLASDQPIGAGTLALRFGGSVDSGVALRDISSQEGSFVPGQIRITDRSGASATVDLRYAQTIDDVLKAINGTSALNVRATAEGDSIRLTDLTGQTVSNLKVQEVGSGRTAASLGLQSIDVASDTALGSDIVQLTAAIQLARLNDGNGVRLRDGVADLEVQFRDGSAALQIDIDADATATLEDVLAALNEADPARLSAQLVGDRIQLTDLTSGSNEFTVQSIFGSFAAEDLGLDADAQAGVIASRRLLGGLKTTLLSSLNGGQGLSALGQIQIQDRSGATAIVDLAGAETLDEVLATINAANVSVTARINHARNGIEISDTSGQSAANFVISSSDSTNTAEQLGIEVNAAVNRVDSGSLDRQVVSAQTSLTTYRFGEAVRNGSFTITDSTGKVGAINLTLLQPKTIGDVLDAINGLHLSLEARINDAGDGIALVDTSGGTNAITVSESGSGQAAHDLGLFGTSQLVDVNGVATHVLAGSTTLKVTVDADDTLQDLATKISELNAPISASVFNEGAAGTVRLSLVSGISGAKGELLVDDRSLGTTFTETTAAQDALLVLGGSNVVVSSSTNEFENIVEGLNVTINGTSAQPVEVRVQNSPDTIATNVKLLVDKYNELVGKIKEFTKFDPNNNTTGILFGTGEILRVELSLANFVSGPIVGAGQIRNLAQIGITVKDDGTLDFDKNKLIRAYEADPAEVEEFFTKPDVGMAAKLDKLIERLAGVGDSLLVGRNNTLDRRIEFNNQRIVQLNAKLERERETLLEYFYRLENTIARMQNNLTALSSIQALPPLTVSR